MSEYDQNFDGETDAVAWDQTGDGVADSVAFDSDQDRVHEVIALDPDQDNVTNVWMVDANENGVFEQALVDETGDGVVDTQVVDVDENGVLDTVVRDQAPANTDAEVREAVIGPTVVGPPSNIDPVTGLIISMAGETGQAVWPDGNRDGDRWDDKDDAAPDDPLRH